MTISLVATIGGAEEEGTTCVPLRARVRCLEHLMQRLREHMNRMNEKQICQQLHGIGAEIYKKDLAIQTFSPPKYRVNGLRGSWKAAS